MLQHVFWFVLLKATCYQLILRPLIYHKASWELKSQGQRWGSLEWDTSGIKLLREAKASTWGSFITTETEGKHLDHSMSSQETGMMVHKVRSLIFFFFFFLLFRSVEDEQAVGASYCEKLEYLLKQSDFVVVVVNLTPDTTGLISHKELSLMKPTATLVNVSRGRRKLLYWTLLRSPPSSIRLNKNFFQVWWWIRTL